MAEGRNRRVFRRWSPSASWASVRTGSDMRSCRVQRIGTREQYQGAVREDLLGFLAIAMAITALLTLVQWQSLFPSLRDCLALAGFPVSARQIFFAKFTALVLLFAAFSFTLNGPIAGLFSTAIAGPFAGESIGPGSEICALLPPPWEAARSSSSPCSPSRDCCSISFPAASSCASRSSCKPRFSSPRSERCR